MTEVDLSAGQTTKQHVALAPDALGITVFDVLMMMTDQNMICLITEIQHSQCVVSHQKYISGNMRVSHLV
jgi:hypothetical protein